MTEYALPLMKRVVCCAAAAGMVGVLLSAPVAIGGEAASRMIDRTLVCRMSGEGSPDPIRYLDVGASPQLGSNAPNVEVFNGHGVDRVTAGFRTGPYAGQDRGVLFFTRTRCTPSQLLVPASHSGLSGGGTALGKRYQCDVPARILIRIRGTFLRTPFLSGNPLARANGNISTGSLAVVTLPDRRPMLFASADGSTGKTKIFISPARCSAR